MSVPARFPVTAREIDLVVARFYERVRADAVLGPVFAAHVEDWPAHERKIAGFWRNAILFERDYDGNPMQKHMAAGNVASGHFAVWLGIFDQVLVEALHPDVARSWSALAHRIGQGLRFGIQNYERPANAAPMLR